MTALTLDSFYPEGLIKCEADLPFEDGTYEVWEREVILNIFQINNRRILYHYKYNTAMKLRLITWHFEFLTAADGSHICNVWRQPTRTATQDLFHSSHWHLYPEQYARRQEEKERSKIIWNRLIVNELNKSPQFNGQLTEANVDEGWVR